MSPGYRFIKHNKSDLTCEVEDYQLNKNNSMQSNKKGLWESKTVWLAVLQGIAGVLTAIIASDPAVASIGWVAFAKSVLDFTLRINTTKELI